jgi:hypothetical protein
MLGRSLNDRIELPDGTAAEIVSIRPKEVYALHDLMENFQNRFPEASGFEKVQIDTSSQGGLQPIAERLQQRQDAVETISSSYETGSIPITLAGQLIGIDAVEMMTGLSTHGYHIKVCQGLPAESADAFLAVEQNQRRGCVLDYLTLHVARRLGVVDVVAEICGPIGIVDATAQIYQRKIFEMEQTIDEVTHSLTLQNGQIFRVETSVKEKGEALDLLKSDADWIRNNCKIIPAAGKKDLSGAVKELAVRFGSDFLDELQAAQGSGLLFVSEDAALRGIGQADFGATVTWLQPILRTARSRGLLSEEGYLKAIVTMVDAKFYFITIDSKDIEASVSGLREVLASRLGGKAADLRSHVDVSFGALKIIWHNKNIPDVAKLAIIGELLTNLVKERSIQEARQILVEFSRFGQRVLGDRRFSNYVADWGRGHLLV